MSRRRIAAVAGSCDVDLQYLVKAHDGHALESLCHRSSTFDEAFRTQAVHAGAITALLVILKRRDCRAVAQCWSLLVDLCSCDAGVTVVEVGKLPLVVEACRRGQGSVRSDAMLVTALVAARSARLRKLLLEDKGFISMLVGRLAGSSEVDQLAAAWALQSLVQSKEAAAQFLQADGLARLVSLLEIDPQLTAGEDAVEAAQAAAARLVSSLAQALPTVGANLLQMGVAALLVRAVDGGDDEMRVAGAEALAALAASSPLAPWAICQAGAGATLAGLLQHGDASGRAAAARCLSALHLWPAGPASQTL